MSVPDLDAVVRKWRERFSSPRFSKQELYRDLLEVVAYARELCKVIARKDKEIDRVLNANAELQEEQKLLDDLYASFGRLGTKAARDITRARDMLNEEVRKRTAIELDYADMEKATQEATANFPNCPGCSRLRILFEEKA